MKKIFLYSGLSLGLALILLLLNLGNNQPTETVNIVEEVLTLDVNETYQLTVELGSNQANQVELKSFDTSVATVSSSGLIRGIGYGVTYIQIRKGDETDYLIVHVLEASTVVTTLNVIFVDTYNETISVVPYTSGGQLVYPTNPTFNQYNFVGWTTTLNQSTALLAQGTAVTSNLVLFAYYTTTPSYVLSFDTDGGNEIQPVTVQAGSTFTVPSVVANENLEFSEWQYNHRLDEDLNVIYDTAQPGDIITVQSNIRFYAFYLTSIPLNAYEFDEIESDLDILIGYVITGMEDSSYFEQFLDSNNRVTLKLPSSYEGLPVIGVEYLFENDEYFFDKVIIPNTYIMIGEDAFRRASINTLVIPDSVRRIYEGAFEYADIKEIQLSENSNLQDIDYQAFYQVTGLTSFIIPKHVLEIGYGAFKESSITSFTFQEGSVLKVIHNEAFEGTGITQLNLPASLISIGAYAFRNTDLVNINVQSNVKYIGDYAFYNDTLKSIVFHEDFEPTFLGEEIVNKQSYGFNSEGFVIAGHVLLGYDHNIQNIDLVIPNSVTHIGHSIFRNLSFNTLTLPNALEFIGDEAFRNITYSQKFDISFPQTLKIIRNRAFRDSNFNETHVTIPSSVVDLSSEAFAFTDGLMTATLQDLTGPFKGYMGGMFWDSSVLEVRVGEGYTRLPYDFIYSSNVRVIYLPSTMEVFDFRSLHSVYLEEIHVAAQLQIKEFSNSLNNDDDVISNFSPYVTNQVTVGYKVFENVLYEYTVEGPFVVPSGITLIPSFAVNTNTTTYDLTGVKTLNSHAFYNTGLNPVVTIDPDLETYYAFTHQATFYYRAERNVQYIINSTGFTGDLFDVSDDYYFRETSYHEIMYRHLINNTPEADANGLHILGNTVVKFTAPAGFNGHVTIPEGIVNIFGAVFYEKAITSVTLPSTLKFISHSAFSRNQISQLTLPEGLIGLGQNAFYANNLTSITFPTTLKYISRYAFAENQLQTLFIPKSVTFIGDDAFRENPLTLQTISFEDPTTLKYARDSFDKSLVVDGLLIVDRVLFYVDEGFDNFAVYNTLVIPNGVLVIASEALSGNFYQDIIVPSSVKKILKEAFLYSKASRLIFAEGQTMDIHPDGFLYSSIGDVILPPSGYTKDFFISNYYY